MSIAIARGWQSAAPRPTSASMAILPPMVGPRAALKDLKAFLGQRSREQVLAATLAVLVTIIIIIIFLVDSKINTAPPGPMPTSLPTRRRPPKSGTRPRRPAARNFRS